MSLRALAEQRLALIRADETRPETTVKQVKQEAETCFTEAPAVSPPMKHANPQKTPENGACFSVSLPSARNSETELLPADIRAGLDRLRAMLPPRLERPEVWSQVRADCLRLASEGWAPQALALGWEPVQLFGCSGAIGGNPDLEGLAVRLSGRRIILLDDRSAIMESRAGTHCLFNVRPMPGAVFIWEVGSRGR